MEGVLIRVQLIVAMLAVTGASGLAVAVSVPRAALDVPVLAGAPEPILLLAPDVSTVDAATSAPADPIGPLALPATLPIETVRGLPHHLLLPDGALVATVEAASADVPLERGIVLRSLPAIPVAPQPEPLALPLAPASRLERAGLPHELPVPRASSAEPVSTQAARAFPPPAPSGGAGPQVLWAGGLALGAVAVLGVALYHRIRPNAALENETRKLIFDAVCSQPGLGVHELSKMAGISYSTATYHLERLIGAGMIVMTPDGNKLCYYKNGGAFSESERRILPILKNEEAAKLFEAILEAPGTYRAALAEKLGVTATTINWHLRRLRDAGLVEETRAGRSAHLYARVDALRPTFLALAQKVEPSEPIIAQKLRQYAVPLPGETTGAGAA